MNPAEDREEVLFREAPERAMGSEREASPEPRRFGPELDYETRPGVTVPAPPGCADYPRK